MEKTAGWRQVAAETSGSTGGDRESVTVGKRDLLHGGRCLPFFISKGLIQAERRPGGGDRSLPGLDLFDQNSGSADRSPATGRLFRVSVRQYRRTFPHFP